jgi:hypothetical protein
MKLFVAAILVAGLVGFCSPKAKAQVNFGTPNNTFTYTTINNGTGGIVGVPIPNSGGLQINVATGSAALPLQNINTNPASTHVSLGDDSGVNVPLGFTFPYWGQNFTNSWMYSNGLVSFANGSVPGAGCCGGLDLRTLRDTRYNYMIAPVWTDLIDTNNSATWYLRNSNSLTYGWYNTHEYYNNNLSSFEVNINSSGAFDIRYGSAFVSTGHTVTSGITGNLSQGQYFQYYYGQGFNIPSPMSYGTTTGSINLCASNPLSDPSCPNYATAYHDQQCLANPLYMSDCPGYTAANLTYQCSINPLYSTSCSGYQQAYHDQQCSINPLFATDCQGYQQAYHDQQCSINVLYATDCPGYAAAYFTQQCNLNPLYSSNCPGYQQAYLTQQCNANQLYSTQCPGYQAAYFNQQCQANGLYSTQCPNYATAYATQQALQQSQPSTSTSSSSTTTTVAVVTTQSTTAPPAAGTVSTTGTVSNPTQVPVIADPVVNNIVATNSGSSSTTSTTSPTSVTSATSVTQTTSTSVASTDSLSVNTTTTSSQSSSSSSSSSGGTSSSTGASNSVSTTTSFQAPVASGSSGSTSTKTPPTKAQIAAAVKTAQSNAESSKSMDDQVKTQSVVIGAMGYVQGFDAYSITMKDAPFYRPYSIYGNQKTVDNRRASRGLFGASDVRHDEMVQSQYK